MDVILITGASRGIGASTAHECARRGHAVVITYREQAAAAEREVAAIRAAGGQALALPLDLAATATFPAFVARLGEHLTREWAVERLAGLVNNAGLGFFEPLASVSEAQFDSLCQVHLKGPFFLTQALLPLLLKSESGSLVFTTSSVGRTGRAGWGAYAVSKFATEGMMQVLADEYKNHGLRVNCINPGGTRTKMRASAFPQEDASKLKTPADIMPLYLYLMGDDSRRKTGISFDAQPGRKPGAAE